MRHLLLHVWEHPIVRVAKTWLYGDGKTADDEIPAFESFGGMITMDHVNAYSLIHNGLRGEQELLVVSGIGAGYLSVPGAFQDIGRRYFIVGAVLGS